MVKIVIDSREPDVIAVLLLQLGVEVERRSVTPGDYILSSECAVERKTTQDFFNSLYSGRLFEQVERLKAAYTKPLMIIEGDVGEELASRLNPRAFWGALLKLQMDYNVPTLNTYDVTQTADLLATLAKRLQNHSPAPIKIRHKPKILSEREQQIYTVCGLPGVGEGLAVRLLSYFGSVRKVFCSSKAELMKVEGIGEVKAERIIKLLDAPFPKQNS